MGRAALASAGIVATLLAALAAYLLAHPRLHADGEILFMRSGEATGRSGSRLAVGIWQAALGDGESPLLQTEPYCVFLACRDGRLVLYQESVDAPAMSWDRDAGLHAPLPLPDGSRLIAATADGETVLYGRDQESSHWLGSVADGSASEARRLPPGVCPVGGGLAPDGHLVVATLRSRRACRLLETSDWHRVADLDVGTGNARSAAWTVDGERLAVLSGSDDNDFCVRVYGGAGVLEAVVALPNAVAGRLAWSPDGGAVAYRGIGGIWSVDVASGTRERLTRPRQFVDPAPDRDPVWLAGG